MNFTDTQTFNFSVSDRLFGDACNSNVTRFNREWFIFLNRPLFFNNFYLINLLSPSS